MLDPGGSNRLVGKVKRRRVKGLVKSVREILEWLFSEPNLRRDKFLRQIVGSSGTKPVSILTLIQFNRINDLTQNIQILRRAAFESKILRLCDFENANDQGGICRRDPAPPPPRDILQKTVYLEGLPKDATVQWLKDLVKDLTHLTPAHISLPRQRTGQSRGFAFIEFGSYSQASNTVKDFNSKKAIATAFLLQSNRRKLFQNSMRQRQLKILDSRPFDSLILPPPSPQFMSKDVREKYLQQKYNSKPTHQQNGHVPNGTSKSTSNDQSSRSSRKRRRDSEKSAPDSKSKARKDSKSSSSRDGSSRRRKSEAKNDDSKSNDAKTPTNGPINDTKRKRKRSQDGAKEHNQDHISKKGKKEEIETCDKNENVAKIISTSKNEEKTDNNSKPDKPDVTDPKPEVTNSTNRKSLFRRARTNSFPPLSGHLGSHSWQYWSGIYPTPIGNAQQPFCPEGSVSHNHYHMTAPAQAEKSTQTDSSYSQMLKHQWRDKNLESKIDQLVKMGRNESRREKRKIPSTIHIPQKPTKRRRKTRSRRRKRRPRKNITRRRRNSSIIIPNWGGLRLKAILASEWSQLKKKYKEIQKQNMRKLKQSLKDSTFLFAGAALRKHIKYDEFLANTSDNEEDADDSCTEMENDFNLPEVGKYKPVTDPRGSRRVVGQAPDYRPGVIVKIQSEKDLPPPLVLRNRFSEYGCVAYVDRYGPKNGFIRFNNQSGAQRSIEKEDFYTLSLLTGQKEEQYWESLLNKREAKRCSERKKFRGVERLVKKAIKQKTKERKLHILFDNDLVKEI